MKSLPALLLEYQKTVKESCEINQDFRFYGSLATLYLQEVPIHISRYCKHSASRKNRQAVVLVMHQCLLNLTKCSSIMDVDLSSHEPTFHHKKLDVMLKRLWVNRDVNFFNNTLFFLQNHAYFTEDWTLDRIIEASQKVIYQPDK